MARRRAGDVDRGPEPRHAAGLVRPPLTRPGQADRPGPSGHAMVRVGPRRGPAGLAAGARGVASAAAAARSGYGADKVEAEEGVSGLCQPGPLRRAAVANRKVIAPPLLCKMRPPPLGAGASRRACNDRGKRWGAGNEVRCRSSS